MVEEKTVKGISSAEIQKINWRKKENHQFTSPHTAVSGEKGRFFNTDYILLKFQSVNGLTKAF